MKILANKSIFFLFIALVLGIPSGGVIYYILNNIEANNFEGTEQTTLESDLNPILLYIEPNQWLKLNKPWSLAWQRQSYAGMAMDTKRGNLLVFGSDTHSLNWNNSVHEFDPIREKWITHYIPSDHVNYSLNKDNIAVAENTPLRPRAMHTFDNVVYDPKNDALFITAAPEHYAIKHEPKKIMHPMWVYQLEDQTWSAFYNNDKPIPSFFAGATSYDPERDAIIAYRHGIWELGPERAEWIRATDEYHHDKYFNMEYDRKNKSFVVFGNNKLTNEVWSYKPSKTIGKKGVWKKHQSKGNAPSADEHFPVAFDTTNNVFLLQIDNRQKTTSAPDSSSAYTYDLTTETYTKIPDTDLPALGMNYMMSYDEKHGVFLLVTGDLKEPPTVWALKLVPDVPPKLQ